MKSRACMIAFLLSIVAVPTTAVAAETTTFFVVRHAEKAEGAGDVPLTMEGAARAEILRGIVAPMRLDAVYATAALRAQQTAKPTATALGISVTTYDPSEANWSARLLKENRKKSILVVGHSNTVPEMIKALTGVELQVGDEFDNFFILSFSDSGASVLRLRYGAANH